MENGGLLKQAIWSCDGIVASSRATDWPDLGYAPTGDRRLARRIEFPRLQGTRRQSCEFLRLAACGTTVVHDTFRRRPNSTITAQPTGVRIITFGSGTACPNDEPEPLPAPEILP